MACIVKRRNRWVIDFYDHAGKRQRLSMPKGSTKTAARERMREIEDQVARGIYLPGKKVPLFSDVAAEWLEYKKPKIRETTWEVYEGHVRNHFKDLNGLKVTCITTATMEKFITKRQNEDMHINTIRKVLVSLNQILSYAVRHKYVLFNPLRDAERPRDPGEKKKEIIVLAPDQIQSLLKTVTNQKYRSLFLLAIMSGAREGELLGLQWGDIDWTNSQMHIQRSYTKGRFFPTKTRTSNRRVDLGPTVINALKLWRLACLANKHDLIFPNEAGEPINYSNMMTRHFFPTLKAAGLPKIRFHDLRHTNASIRLEMGENIKYIQKQLGHSSPTVTLNVYAHLMKSSNPDAASRLENVVFSATGHKMVTAGN